MNDLSTTLTAIGIALGTIVTGILSVVAVAVPRLVKAWLDIAQEKLEAQRTTVAKEAIAIGVAAADEAGRTYLAGAANKGAAKMELALTVARGIAPRATASIAAPQLTGLAQAAVATRRASLVTPSLIPLSMPPGASLVPMVLDSAPTIPRPARMPDFDERPTPAPEARR